MRALPQLGPGALLLALTVQFAGCVHQDDPPLPKPAARRDSPLAGAPPASTAPYGAAAGSAPVGDVARRFVEVGLRGERLHATPCVRHEAVACGAEGVGVVKTFTIDSTVVRGDSALVAMRYVEIGSVVGADSTLQYVSRPDTLQRIRPDTLVLRLQAGAWHVVRSDTMPRVSARFAFYYFDLDKDARDRISDDADESWDFPDGRPVFTLPSALTQLPPSVRDSLEARRCRILQKRGDTTRNVVRGSFFGEGSDDWAVVCATSAASTILVFPHAGGPPASLDIVTGDVPGFDLLPNLDQSHEVYGCTTGISPTPGSALRDDILRGDIVGPPQAKPMSPAERRAPLHDGLASGDCEGLSNVYYWTGLRWVIFGGGD